MNDTAPTAEISGRTARSRRNAYKPTPATDSLRTMMSVMASVAGKTYASHVRGKSRAV